MKIENINFIIILLIIVLPAIMLYFTLHPMSNELGEGAKELVGSVESEENGNTDVEVAKTLLIFPIAATGVLLSVILSMLIGFCIMVTFVSLLLIILARSMIAKDKTKKVAYRILMTLVYIPYTFLAIIMVHNIIYIIPFIYGLLALVGLIVNYYNTYSNKMYVAEEGEVVIDNPEEVKEENKEENNNENE